jgi:hypothetical protein
VSGDAVSGAQVKLDASGLRPLVGELGQMTPVMRAALRSGFRTAGNLAARRAQVNASWSRRIPGALQVRPLTGARSAGVFLRVNSARAPHARAFEGLGRRATRFFRHPVFGNRDVWVDEATRPFMVPAVRDTRGDANDAAVAAVNAAARAGRFTR